MNAEQAYLAAVQYAASKHHSEREKMLAAIEVARANGISIRQIAAAAGVNKSTIHRWLSQHPTEGN